MSSWNLTLPADELPLALAQTDAAGVILRTNRGFDELFGTDTPTGPEGLSGLLLAAGVDAPGDRLAASFTEPQTIATCVGGQRRFLRLSSHARDDGRALHLLQGLRDGVVDRSRHAELQSLIAHDLRSPLAVIQGYAGLLATGTPGPLNATQAEFLRGIDTKIIEVTRLLDDFLDLSRLDAGAMTLAPQPLGLADLLAQVNDEHRRAAAARNLTVTVTVAPPDLEVQADPLRLKQILDNLVGNAIKYNCDGGWVRLDAGRVGDRIRIGVADGGPGLGDLERQRIFEPFARGAAAAEVSGSGLGLVVVQRLVALHGGDIVATSAPGEGTTFTVELPHRAAVDPVTEPVQ